MTKLSAEEKTLLKKIADGSDELLAKRAVIVLMTDNGRSAANIAKEVSMTSKTVQRWQKEFAQKRLAIFPAEALNSDSALVEQVATMVAEMEAQTTAESPAQTKKAKKVAEMAAQATDEFPAKKKKVKKVKHRHSKGAIEYPVREEIGLEPTDSLAEAGRKVLSFLFGRMLTHEPGTRLGSDIEALHDMRVATRRMRAAFRVFGNGFKQKAAKPLLAGLRATGRALGQVRDLDVFIDKLQEYQLTLPEKEQAGLQPLLEALLAQREEARQEMIAYLDSKKYLHFKQDLLKFVTTEGFGAKAVAIDTPTPYQLRHVAPGLIYQHYEAVHAYETVLPKASLDTLHRLRITYKSMRYTLEFLNEVLGEESRMVIAEVKALQDHLGELNDARVAGKLVSDFVARWDKSQKPSAEEERPNFAPLTAYLESRLAEQQRLLDTFPEAWARFNHPNFRRNLALAVAVL